MFEELFEELNENEVGTYLSRLEIAVSDAEKPDLTTLNQLIYAHQTHIVFENLDAWLYHTTGSLGIKALYGKIILGGRGGYCFELNALFHALLTALGYHASPCMCRILEGDLPEHTQISHRGELVYLDGNAYFCDVGFGGPMPAGALLLQEGRWQTHHGQDFCIRHYDKNWITLFRRTDRQEEEAILQFTLMSQSPVDYLPLHVYLSTSPDSDFVKDLYMNIRTQEGSKALWGNRLSIHTGKQHITKTLSTKEEVLETIQKEFHIPLS